MLALADYDTVTAPALAPQWFALFVSGGDEYRVARELLDLKFATYIPEAQRWKSRRGFRMKHREPLFGSYVFVRFDRLLQEWGCIVDVKRARYLLPDDDEPFPIPDVVIDKIKLAERIGMFDKTAPPKVGIEVEITEGPFEGLIGKIRQVRSAERADVLLKAVFLGIQRVINMPIAALREV